MSLSVRFTGRRGGAGWAEGEGGADDPEFEIVAYRITGAGAGGGGGGGGGDGGGGGINRAAIEGDCEG